jgi:hypothetical protein
MDSTAGQAQVKLRFWRSVFFLNDHWLQTLVLVESGPDKAAVLENGLEYKCAVAGFISKNLKRNEI